MTEGCGERSDGDGLDFSCTVVGGLGAVVAVEEVGMSNSITCASGGMADLDLAFFRLCSSLGGFPSPLLRFEGLAPRRRGDSNATRE